ncbi:MAG TPA: TonB-dependent receptor [Candidatus Aquilonibacter sp.]|nr:TonB-dependent receptor [Candidatus Aquilonibacter sp.]
MSFFLAALLAISTPTATPSPSPPPLIGSVSVATGSLETLHRLPLPASLLTATQLQSLPAATGDEVLRALPGFDRTRSNSAFTNYGQLRVSFAGAGNDRGLILVDNVFAQDGFGGQVDWAAYPSANLTRAELLRGPGSALYGSGAIGGVLSLSTFAPTAQPNGPALGSVSIAGGTYDYGNAYAQATAALAPKLSIAVATSSQQLSYRAVPPAYQTPVDRPAFTRSRMASLRVRYAAGSDTSFEYAYRGAWDNQQEGRPNYDFWRNFVQHSLTFAHAWKNASFNLTSYVRNTFVTNRADKSSAPGMLLYTQYVPSHESGFIGDWIVGEGPSTFELRGDARFVNGVSDQYNAGNVLTASGSGVQRTADIAAQNTWRFSRGQLVAGLAATSISLPEGSIAHGGTTTTIAPRTDRVLSPRIAARYDLSKRLAVRASAGTGLRAPFLNELVRGYVIGPVSYLPNPALVPERSASESAGFDWSNGRSELSIDYIATFVTNAISFLTVDATHQIRSNFARAQVDGVTASLTRRLGPCANVSAWATQQHSRVTDGTTETVGKQLPYVPEDSAYVGYDTQAGALHVGVNVAYLGQTFADDRNLEPLGTAVTAGFTVSAPLTHALRLIVSGDNVTNARYRSSIDRYGPPAVFWIGLSMPVNKQASATCE